MIRAKQAPRKKNNSNKSRIITCVVAGVAMLVLVFSVFALTHERLNYAEAKDNTSEILKTKDAIVTAFDRDSEDVAAAFDTAASRCGEFMSSLGASNTMKDKKVEEKYNEAKAAYENVVKIVAIRSDLVLLQEMTDANLAQVKISRSEYLRNMTTELSEYRTKVKQFKEKYDNKAGDSKDVMKAYGQLVLEGNALEQKYKETSFEVVSGMSRGDILDFYAKIEELNKLLSEKV